MCRPGSGAAGNMAELLHRAALCACFVFHVETKWPVTKSSSAVPAAPAWEK